MQRPPAFIALLSVVIAMASIQSGASLAKTLFQQVTPQGLTMLRLLFAALILGALFRPWRTPVTRKQLGSMFYYGASLGGMNLLFYLSLQRIPLGVAVAFEFTGPLALALVSSRRLIDLLWVGLAIAGIALLSPLQQASNLDPTGVAFALGAGACWALYILFGQRAGKELPGHVAAAGGMAAAALVVTPIALLMGGATGLNTGILPLALVVAVLSSALPYSLEMVALKSLPTAAFSILMSLEPVLAALSGWLFIDERLAPIQWTAIGLIVAASLGSTLTAPKRS
jgi:inner membrane transporter RhtA